MIYAEDLRVGSVTRLGSHLVTTDEILTFATSWDPLTLHIDPERASRSRYGQIVASGIHTLGVFQRLAVEAVYHSWALVAGRSLREAHFIAPVKAGTLLTGSLVVDQVRLGLQAGALVGIRGELHSSESAVLTLAMDVYVEESRRSGLDESLASEPD